MKGSSSRETASRLYSLAQQIAHRLFGDSFAFVQVLTESAAQLESRHAEHGKPENSRWNKCAAIPDDDESNQARYKNTQAFNLLKDLKKDKTILAAQVLTALARLTKIPIDKFSTPSDIKAAMDAQFTLLAQAIHIYEVNLGYDHPETADAYSKIALAY